MSDTTTVSGDQAGLTFASGPGRWVLLATVLGSALASIDATVVGIALLAIGRDFSTSLAALQWLVTAYTLTLAGLLLFAGALGDRYGRKRIFLTGVVWFALASLLCGVAPGALFLVVARAVQGVGAALLTPGSLAILEASFGPCDRGKAIGAWSGFGGVGLAIGQFTCEQAALKVLYLAVRNLEDYRGRNVGIRSSGWQEALQAFTIYFDGRIPTP